jgi:large subunit ribosomal protein L23
MEMNEIIKKPLLTEKTYKLMDSGVYTFMVNKHVNKIEVRNAVEFIFDVTVGRVNIIKVPKKPKKVGRYSGFVPAYKKAIVTVIKGEINFFPEDNSDTTKKIKETNVSSKNTTTSEISDAEKRAAEKIAMKQKEKAMKAQNANLTNKTPQITTANKKTNRGGDK